MAAREQTGDCELYRLILAYDNFTNLLCERVNMLRHSEMICGNVAVRKRGYAEKDQSSLTEKRHCVHVLLAFVVAFGQEIGDAHFCPQGNGSGRKARAAGAGNGKKIGRAWC